MGSSESKGQMLIACDKASFNSGEKIKGNIYIQLIKSIRKSTSLYLVFSGTETTHWQSGILSSTDGKSVFRKEHKKFMTWEEGLHKGQYEIPFSFLLPEGLYSSFKLNEEKYSAGVTYKLNAIVSAKGRKMKNTAKIEIINEMNVPRFPSRIYKNYQIKRSCFKTSSFEAKGELSNNVYYSNETIEFELSYNNSKSALDISAIHVLLIRKVILRTENSELVVYQKTIGDIKLGRLRSGDNQKSPFQGKFHLEKLEKDAPRTILTKIINCKYFLKIEHVLNGCCVRPVENLEVEIEILPDKSLLIPQVIESPDNWNPEVYPVARLSYIEFQPSAPVLED